MVSAGAELKRALSASTAFFSLVFALGFALGTIRVILVEPRLGPLAATLAEAPLMLVAAFFASRWAVARWRVPRAAARWVMCFWFLGLLFTFETVLGMTLFGRTAAGQWTGLATPAGLLGLSVQLVAALLPVLDGAGDKP